MLEQVRLVGCRARRLLWIRELLTVLAAVAFLVPAIVLLDYAVHNEAAGWRWFLSATVLISLIAICLRGLLPILRMDARDVQVARWVERGLPDLRDRLSSAVEFLQRAADDPTAGSPDLRAALVQQVRGELTSLDLLQVLETRSVRRAASLAMGTLLVVGAMVVWIPIDWRVGLSRLAFPWSAPRWPTTHSLAFDSLPTQVAQGGRLSIRVIDTNGKLPSRVHLWYWPDDRTSDQAIGYEMNVRDNVADWTLPRLKQSFQIRAEGGDDREMDWVRVHVVDAPKLMGLQITVSPPAYTRWPSESVPLHFHALQGSRVGLKASANRPLRSARVLMQQEKDAEIAIPLELKTNGSAVLLDEQGESAWTITTTTSFHFELIDRRGILAAFPSGSVTAIRDAEPSLELWQPDQNLRAGPRTMIPLRAEITDDLTIQTVRLIYNVSHQADEEAETVVLFQRQAAPRTQEETLRGPDVLPLATQWNLAHIQGLEPGVEISWYLQAVDNHDQQVSSRTFHWTLNSDHDLELDFARQEQQILARIADARDAQHAAAMTLQEMLKSLVESRTPVERSPEELQALAIAQRNVRESLTDSPASVLHDLQKQWQTMLRSGIDARLQERHHHDWIACLEQLDTDVLLQLDSLLRQCVQITTAADRQDRGTDLVSRLGRAGSLQTELIRQLDGILSEVQRQDFVHHLTQQAFALQDEQRVLLRTTMDLLDATLTQPPDATDESLRDALRTAYERQMELARKTEQFLARLDNLPPDTDPTAAVRFSAARQFAWQAGVTQRMRRAADELEQTRVANATEQQKAAAAVLQQIADRLSDDSSRTTPETTAANGGRESAALDIPLEQLQLLAAGQTELCESTTALARQVTEAGSTTQTNSAAEALADQQSALAAETRSVSERADGRKVVSWLLRQTASEMERVAELLHEGELSQTTQSVQQEVRDQLIRLTQLLTTEQEQDGSGAETPTIAEHDQLPAQQEDPLVAQLSRAEIQLLLDLQQRLNQRVVALKNHVPAETPPDPATMRALEDVARRQGELADLLNELIQLPEDSSQEAPR